MGMKKTVAITFAGLTLTAAAAWAQEGELAKATTHELDAIVVSADRIPEPARQVSQNVTVIDESEIKKSAANNVADLLKQKGIQIYDDGADGYGNEGVVIRGGRSSMHGFDIAGDILVLIDGHRSGTDSMSQLELGNTARIEIIRGPGAVQYGAAAMGGVINIITKKGGVKTEAGLELGWGSFGEQRSKAALSGRIGSFDYAVAGSYYSRDEYKVGGDGGKFENSDLKYRSRYSANLGWNFNERHRVGFAVQGSDTRDAGKGPDGTSKYRYDTRQNRSNYNLDFSYEGSSEDDTKAWLARYFRGEVEYDLRRHSSATAPRQLLSYNTNEYQGAQGQFSWNLGRFQFVSGVDWMSYEFDQNQSGPATSNARKNMAQSDFDNLGAFLLAKAYLMEDKSLTLSGGLRYDEFDVTVDSHRLRTGNIERRKASMTRDNWAPSLGLAYSPLEFLKLRANYAQAFKMPLPRQLTGFTIMMTTPFIGNENLQPEESDNWDAGFDLEYEALSFTATYFHSKYKNLITYETRNDGIHYPTTYYWYYNEDTAKIRGLELGASFDFGEHFGWGCQVAPYAYWTRLLKFENDKGEKLANRARDSLSFGLKFNHDEVGLAVNLDATYYGKQYNSDGLISDLGQATVWDLNLSKRLYRSDEHGDLSVKVALKNIFDKQYANNDEQWMPGASAYVGLAWNY